MKHITIIEVKGELILCVNNFPVRALSPKETEIVKYRSTLRYKVTKMSNSSLLNSYLKYLYRGMKDEAIVCRKEILNRMSNK